MALVIGVDDYFIAPKLRACGKDAKAFALFLQEKMGFPAPSITLMTDDAEPKRKPDRINIMRVAKSFSSFRGTVCATIIWTIWRHWMLIRTMCQAPVFLTTSCATNWKLKRRAVAS